MANILLATVVLFLLTVHDLGARQLGAGDEGQWEAWKRFYGKKYENKYEENYRKAIWMANLEVSTGILDTYMQMAW